MKKAISRKNNSKSDDDTVRYKLNTQYFNNVKSTLKKSKIEDDDDGVRYKLATITPKSKSIEKKLKSKPKIKVNFWSNKPLVLRSKNRAVNIQDPKRRHTITTTDNADNQNKPTANVRKRVSFLPSPIFTENHVPMVTVPDDLTIQLNSANVKASGNHLNLGYNNETDINYLHEQSKKKSRISTTQASLKNCKSAPCNSGQTNWGNENELEFFSKYVVQKLRRMETNQRIYSENLINTVLMLGQLGKLNSKSKIDES